MWELVQIVGALLILAAYVLGQARALDVRSYPYLVLNTLGAAALTITAVVERQWGFVLLEGVWTIVSVWGLALRLRVASPV
jgi:hypothetical protein